MSAKETVPAIEFIGYSFSYEGASEATLHDITFKRAPGTFTVLCGATGCGKSTLLRAMKPEVAVAGVASGQIKIMGQDPSTLDPRESAARIGFVMQDPEAQLVTDTVWHELAFGLENLGVERAEMRRRVAETAHFFGIGGWFDRKVTDLSGGQKQLLNLAAVVVMQPSLLVLDEPTSQLDPIAAKGFFDVLGRVNAELGITVIIIEHRLEDVLPMADRVLYIEDHTVHFDGTRDGFITTLIERHDKFTAALPAATRIAQLVRFGGEDQPVTVRDGRRFLAGILDGSIKVGSEGAAGEAGDKAASAGVAGEQAPFAAAQGDAGANAGANTATAAATAAAAEGAPYTTNFNKGDVLLRGTDVWFRYSKQDPFVLRGVDVEVHAGELHALVGGNGSGKSTLLSALSGVKKPERGKIRKTGDVKVALLAQDPKSLFVCDTLMDDLMEWREYGHYTQADAERMMERFDILRLASRHPYDLSGGETQKAAIVKVLLLKPDVLLMDEPVKGIDAVTKQVVAKVMVELVQSGVAVLFTAHDLEFVSQVANTCSMMFGCEITCTQDCHGFFQDNLFYSTATSRISRRLLDGCVTTEDVAREFGRLGIISSSDAESIGFVGGGVMR